MIGGLLETPFEHKLTGVMVGSLIGVTKNIIVLVVEEKESLLNRVAMFHAR